MNCLDKKKRNIGFVKMTADDLNTRISVYMRGLYVEKGMKGSVYLIGKANEEHIIGELFIQNNVGYGEYQIRKNGMTCNYEKDEEIIGISILVGDVRCMCRFQSEETCIQKEDLWLKMKYIYPTVHPFEENHIEKEYLSITPNEISFFSKEDHSLQKNEFLLKGYGNYKYIILIREKESYLIGVPGIYYLTEAANAKKNGFWKFSPVKGGKPYEGAFGYYLKQIRFH
ncbi:MAG: hypothetical protein GX567_04605 [Clostridia bacterium]|nr:hypothetical protein [Clostridia bacterium]